MSHLRDDVARALHEHRVAHAQVQLLDSPRVVQCRRGDGDATERDWPQLRHRRHGACSADGQLNAEQGRDRRLQHSTGQG
eukprot:194754-Chlamydomonas_euryale.AAC.8